MKKEAKVIMLPTRDKVGALQIHTSFVKGILRMYKTDIPSDYKAQHLYFTSDEEIKEGVNQYYIDKYTGKLSNSGGAQYESKQNVVIATTDKSLTVPKITNFGMQEECGGVLQVKSLPKIQQSFIEAYVKAEGKIDKVMVEYEDKAYPELMEGRTWDDAPGANDPKGRPFYMKDNFIIKTREDNTVIISKCKEDMYSREDVEALINKFRNDLNYPMKINTYPDGSISDIEGIDKWIEDNL